MILIGLPHSEISGSTFATNYPELFAGDRVLLRHSAPRHPPCALCSLTYKPASSPVIDRADAIDMNGDRYVSSFDETRSSLLSSSSLVKVRHLLVQVRARQVAMHRPERTNWKLVIDRLRPPADLGRRGPLMMPAPRAGVHSTASCKALRAFQGRRRHAA